jgi:hypothetical protein
VRAAEMSTAGGPTARSFNHGAPTTGARLSPQWGDNCRRGMAVDVGGLADVDLVIAMTQVV